MGGGSCNVLAQEGALIAKTMSARAQNDVASAFCDPARFAFDQTVYNISLNFDILAVF